MASAAEHQAIAEAAARALRAGGLIAFPTETVYGLGADAENEVAVRRIFAVKGRPADHPLIVHLASGEALGRWTAGPPSPLALALAARFWPGPLTLILRRGPRVLDVVSGGQDTVGLRVPAHPLALAILRAHGGGVAAPSANRFGKVSPTTAQHVREDLGADVDYVADGGPSAVGIESTIVDLSSGAPSILRPGGITREALEPVVGAPVPVRGAPVAGGLRAPGVLASHYAPRAQVALVAPEALGEAAAALLADGRRVAVLAGARALAAAVPAALEVVRLSLPDGDEGLARDLYAALREADRRGVEVVVVARPTEDGLGLALLDRLGKASAAR